MTDDPLIGRQLANFHIEHVLGRGGMAQVYYGQDLKLNRPVAIKVIDARFRGNPAYAKRFVREAQAVATWRHENIAQVYYADEDDGLYYFAMEYIDGLNLAELISQYTALGELTPHTDVLLIGRAVASALDYAHQKGVIHRDVKPSNIVLDKQGRAILTDFGLALLTEIGTRGQILGSPHYIAPEQAISSARAVPQSDLYSVGVILYEMFTGQLPFDAEEPMEVALLHISATPRPPRELRPAISPDLEIVILKCLAKEPAERYPKGAALAEA